MLIEIEPLLEPLANTPSPVGADLREGGPGSELYLGLKDARAAARTAERDAGNATADMDPLRAGAREWATLVDDAQAILSRYSKDIEVAAWTTEALLRLDGIEGLADGFALMAGLIERYWSEGLWPIADEDGDETRLTALFGIFGRGGTGTLLQPIKLVPLSDRAGAPVTLWSAELAAAAAPPRNSDEEIQAKVDERRAAAIDTVTGGIGRSSKPFLIALRAALVRALAELERLMQAIDRLSDVGRFGSQIAEPLSAALGLLDAHAAPAFVGTAAADGSSDKTDISRSPGAVRNEPHAPGSREEALSTLLALATFFDAREPQSFVGPALRDVVRRARMPLEGLLLELLPDTQARVLFLQRAGIRLTPSEVVDTY